MTPAQFQPSGAPGAGARNAMSTVGAVQGYFAGEQTMMDRASRLRMDEESHGLKMQQSELLLPVVRAKARADVAEAGAQLSAIEQSEEMRRAANEMAPQARKDFDALMIIADPEGREQAAFEWVARYGQLANIKAFSAEWTAKKDIIAKIHVDTSTLRNLNAKTEAEKDLIAARGEAATKVATVRGESAVEVAAVRGEASRDAAAIRSEGQKHEAVRLREALSAAEVSGDEEGAQFYRDILAKKGHVADPKKLEIERLRELRAAAEDAGDAAGAKEYSDRIAKLTTIVLDPAKQAIATVISKGAGGAPAAAPATTPRPAAGAAPVAPAAKAPAQMSDAELEAFMFGSPPKK